MSTFFFSLYKAHCKKSNHDLEFLELSWQTPKSNSKLRASDKLVNRGGRCVQQCSGW